MTRRQLADCVRALVYRRRLADTLPTIDAAIRAYLAAARAESVVAGGYRVTIIEGELRIARVPTTDRRQLRLPAIHLTA